MNNFNLDILKKQLSPRKYITLLEFIAKGDFSLDKLNLLLIDSQNRIAHEQNDINALDRQLGAIQIAILGRINRLDTKFRTKNQIKVLEKYSVIQVQETMEDFRKCLEDFKKNEEEYYEILQDIRNVFIDSFPEALSSPRNSRSQLETSPTRFFMPKSASSPNLSPRISKLFKSPRRIKSHK